MSETYRAVLRRILDHHAPNPVPAGVVVCLCASWCGVCRDYRSLFDSIAREHAGLRFFWIDVEDEAELVDDLDVETFPTLLVARGDELVHAGPVLPREGHLRQLAQRAC